MSRPGLAFGLNLSKKPSTSKPAPPKRKPMFGAQDDSDDDAAGNGAAVTEIGGDLDDFTATTDSQTEPQRGPKSKGGPPSQPPKLNSKTQTSTMFGDLSGSLVSSKNAEAAAEVDANVYEYDSVYDSLKPKKHVAKEDEERRPKYMRGLMQAAEVRKRDALIAEEKKIAREREEEGEEYADKEKFVTGAYKKQQEENKRLEEEEKKREEAEAKKNQGGGMSAFYKQMLNKDQERHSEAMKAAEDVAKSGTIPESNEEESAEQDKTDTDLAKEANEKGASVTVNEDGQIVDHRQLLRGGLNLGAKKPPPKPRDTDQAVNNARRETTGMQVGRKQAMRERQSRMLAEQLEQSLKRARDDEESKREEAERNAKSRKTEGEILSAKERYLARKKAAEEAKKSAGGE